MSASIEYSASAEITVSRGTISPAVININLDGSLHKVYSFRTLAGKRRCVSDRTHERDPELPTNLRRALDERMRLDRNHGV